MDKTLPDADAETGHTATTSEPVTAAIVTSHDTPPTLLIMDGSFIVETDKPDFDEKEEAAGSPKKYRRRPDDARRKVYLAHIKVVDGSGEMLYRGNYHDPASDLSVAITTAENDVVTFGSSGNKFEITTSSNKKLLKTAGDDKPVGTKRQGRFRCRLEDAGSSPAAFKSVAVKKGGASIFAIALADLPDNGKELKVMGWLVEG